MAGPRRGKRETSDIKGARILLVEARYYDGIADLLLAGAMKELQGAGAAVQTGGMDPNSVFAKGGGQTVNASSAPPEAYRRAAPVDLSSFGGLSESTHDEPAPGKARGK